MKDQTNRLLRLLQERGADLHALLVRVTLREDVAEDLLQDLFLRLTCAEGFANAINDSAFARTTAMRLAFDWRRSQRVRRAEGLTAELPCNSESPLAKAIANDELRHVLDAMAELSETDCQILAMRYLEQASYDEIAKVIETNTHQARARCAKAMANLRRLLNGPPLARPTESRHAE